MELYLIGGSWITDKGFGTMRDGSLLKPGTGEPILPDSKKLFLNPLTRYGRFDRYTKLGCAGVALALKEAGLDDCKEKKSIGIVISTGCECYETDVEFFKTTQEGGGVFSSPNKFSYTLPGIVLGECAVYFKLTGPTFCVGENLSSGLGFTALWSAINLLKAGDTHTGTHTMVAGWLDYIPDDYSFLYNEPGCQKQELYRGAIFCVISTSEYLKERAIKTLNSEQITGCSILDLFQ
jgi:3-oxoacyl-(acyl-carrier-protein) synthase